MTEKPAPVDFNELSLETIRWVMFGGIEQFAPFSQPVADAFWGVIEALDELEQVLTDFEDSRRHLTTSGGVAAP